MGNLLAGAAMRCITPTEELLARISAEDKMAQFDGIYEDLYIRVIVLSDGVKRVLLCGADLIHFPGQQKLCDRVAAEFGIDPMGCVLSCTHNHEAPGCAFSEGDDYSFRERKTVPGGAMETYGYQIHDAVCDAVKEAIEHLVPAKLGAITGQSFINACRDLPTPCGGIQLNNFHGDSDHDLVVIRVADLEDKTIGMFVNHATHSNFMVWNVYDKTFAKVLADVGGGVSRFVEKANRNQFPVIWCYGAAGNQNPVVRSTWRSIEVDDEGNFTWVQRNFNYEDNLFKLNALRATQGMEILELVKKIDNYTEEFSFSGTEEYREIPAREAYVKLGLYFERNFGKDCKHNLLFDERPEPVILNKKLRYRLRLADICGVGFVGFNSESYSALGKMVKAMIPAKNVVVQCMSYGHAGYIPDAEGERINGFGTCMSNAVSGAATEEAYRDAYEVMVKRIYG